jgi:IS5 family transposase
LQTLLKPLDSLVTKQKSKEAKTMAKKLTYRIRNWSDYNKSLVGRGSLTLWFDEESIKKWHNVELSGKRGRSPTYSDMAIECMLTLKAVYRLPLRATQGFVLSLAELLKLPISIPDYTTLSRRQGHLEIAMVTQKTDEPLHAVFDSTGLKIFGEGEWKVRQHGYGKRRTWRKLHLGIDEATGEIIASALTTCNIGDSEMLADLVDQIDRKLYQASGDGAYDSFENYELLTSRGAKVTIPPRKNSKIKQHGNSKKTPLLRDETIRSIRSRGHGKWKKQSGYCRRSLAETAMFRIKTIFGDKLAAIGFNNQATEAFVKCNALNKMTQRGMPVSYAI